MAVLRVNPTRMELSRLKKRLRVAVRGHKLLKDKRDEMVRRFIALIRENRDLRIQVEKALTAAMQDFFMARASMDPLTLKQAVLYPARTVELTATTKNIMSVDVPSFSLKVSEGGGYPYGFAFTSAQLDGAILRLSDVLAEMLRLAEVEKTCDMLADEIQKTRRRVNALEYVMIPQMEETIRYIKMKLDENERGNLARLMKVKSMIAAREQ